MQFDSTYKAPIIFAVIIHVLVLWVIFTHFAMPQGGSNNTMNIIHAHAIMTRPVVHHSVAHKRSVKKTKKTKKTKKIIHHAALKKAVVKKSTPVVHHKPKMHKAIIKSKPKLKPIAKTKVTPKPRAQTKALAAKSKALEQALLQEQLQSETDSMNALDQQIKTQQQIDAFQNKIAGQIGHHWLVPESASSKLKAQLQIKLGPGGIVLNVVLLKSSGNASLDRSAIAAVYQASPLPVPADPKLFDNFRVMNLTVHPEHVTRIKA